MPESGHVCTIFLIIHIQVQGREGSTITLYAGVASKPKAIYEWSLNNVEILSQGRSVIVLMINI